MITQQVFSTYRSLKRSFHPAAKGLALSTALGLTLALGACASGSKVAETDGGVSEETAEAVQTADSQTADSQAKIAGESIVYAEDGVAIGGADPVAYFTDDTFVAGSTEHTYEWNGATWQFASAENRDLFAESPEEYAPQYGGYCAWAVGQNALAAIDPNAWSIVDGKLYLNANERIQNRWNEDIPGNIALADENWPTLSIQ